MKDPGITPLGDRVLVRIIKVEERTKGGIILPEEYRDKKEMAQLEAVLVENGETADLKLDFWPAPGAHVLITKYAGTICPKRGDEDEEYRVVNADDIIAVIEKEEA